MPRMHNVLVAVAAFVTLVAAGTPSLPGWAIVLPAVVLCATVLHAANVEHPDEGGPEWGTG
jgi:hypothetical protein